MTMILGISGQVPALFGALSVRELLDNPCPEERMSTDVSGMSRNLSLGSCEDRTEGRWDRGTCPWVQEIKRSS